MKKIILTALAVALVVAGISNATAIKTWTTETLHYSDLNSNFEHIHNTMIGGHGTRLVNADVSTSAAIAHSKLETPALVPKAWAMAEATCTGASAAGTACTVTVSSGGTVQSGGSTGTYRFAFTSSRADTNYAVFAQANGTAAYCRISGLNVSYATITCHNDSNVATDTGLAVVLYDNL